MYTVQKFVSQGLHHSWFENNRYRETERQKAAFGIAYPAINDSVAQLSIQKYTRTSDMIKYEVLYLLFFFFYTK